MYKCDFIRLLRYMYEREEVNISERVKKLISKYLGMKQEQIVLERSSKLNLDPEFYKVGEVMQCTMCTL